MQGYVPEELAWALARERAEEARRTRPHIEWPPSPEPLRSWLARLLVRVGICLDPTARETALRAADNGC